MTFKEFRHTVGRLLGIKKYLAKIDPGQRLDIGKLLYGKSDFVLTSQSPKGKIDVLGDKQPVVTMSNFGRNGRFGNQLFQYTFLRLVAERQSAQLQLPVWAGSAIFGLSTPDHSKTKIKIVNESEMTASDLINLMRVTDKNFQDLDYDGHAQMHTSCYAADKDFIRSLFVFDKRLGSFFERALSHLGLAQKKIIAIHLRRGDYGYDRYFRAPCSWYEKWVNHAGYSPDEYIIYICSESPKKYRKRFPQFTVITSDDLKCPAQLAPYLDFMIMTLADAVATSNSSFSFFATMLNRKTNQFYRPDFDQLSLVQFDPWNANPLLIKELSPVQHKYLKSID
jgi:hypothetical protein